MLYNNTILKSKRHTIMLSVILRSIHLVSSSRRKKVGKFLQSEIICCFTVVEIIIFSKKNYLQTSYYTVV